MMGGINVISSGHLLDQGVEAKGF